MEASDTNCFSFWFRNQQLSIRCRPQAQMRAFIDIRQWRKHEEIKNIILFKFDFDFVTCPRSLYWFSGHRLWLWIRPPGFESWMGLIYYEASITAQGLPEPTSLRVPEQLNIKAVTGACKLIDGCSLALFSATVSVVSAGICHRNKVNSIAWLYREAQP